MGSYGVVMEWWEGNETDGMIAYQWDSERKGVTQDMFLDKIIFFLFEVIEITQREKKN